MKNTIKTSDRKTYSDDTSLHSDLTPVQSDSPTADIDHANC